MRSQLNRFVLSLVVAGMPSAMCAAADRPAVPVGATFQDILKRVVQRDTASGAIRQVEPRDDAPRYGRLTLDFSITQRGEDECDIVLAAHMMSGGVFEQYRLRLDPAIREELAKQKRYQQQQADEHAGWVEAQNGSG